MAITGAAWSRALRSRLLQQRLALGNASQQFELRTASKILRSYTTATAGQDEPYISADQDTSLASLSAPRSTLPDNASGRNSRRPKVSSGESEARKREDLLMEIAQQSSSHINRKHVRLEMEWVQDPLLLAQRVSTALRGGDPAMAVALAREATKQIPGTKFVVAWNRIFGYCFDQGHPKPALRFFNDVSFTWHPSNNGLKAPLADFNRDLLDEKARWKTKPSNVHYPPHGPSEILQGAWLQHCTNCGSHL